jgi:methyl-accepting chemotaxis protein
MGEITSKINRGGQIVSSTHDSFDKVQVIAGEVATLIQGIASASESQSEKVRQIQSSVTEMDKVAQQNMASAEELAAAMSAFKR